MATFGSAVGLEPTTSISLKAGWGALCPTELHTSFTQGSNSPFKAEPRNPLRLRRGICGCGGTQTPNALMTIDRRTSPFGDYLVGRHPCLRFGRQHLGLSTVFVCLLVVLLHQTASSSLQYHSATHPSHCYYSFQRTHPRWVRESNSPKQSCSLRPNRSDYPPFVLGNFTTASHQTIHHKNNYFYCNNKIYYC